MMKSTDVPGSYQPKWKLYLVVLCALCGLVACGVPTEVLTPDEKPEGWTTESHSSDAKANYELIFNNTKVHRLDITIAASNWQKMQDNMTELLGTFGQGGGKGGQPGGQPPGGQPPGGQPGGQSPGGQPGGQTGGGGSVDLIPEDPTYVPCNIKYEGKEWRQVGIRYKGNSSLQSGWSGGSYKLPFRLHMDKYEEEYTSTKNQRFYGFKKLTFGNGFSDPSLVREMIASELYREIGLPVARVAFYRIYIDHGDGSKYFGLYTMVEDPDGPMLEAQFKKAGGNLYKPDGAGADWTQFVEAGFVKKTNESDADWSDVKASIEALHSSRDDAAVWRTKLEAGFNVDGFLRWLALSTLMGHWDTYGNMTHNYYLYADPGDAGRLQWLSWDHNMVILGNSAPKSELPLDLKSVDGSKWPLIRYLIDDPTYKKRYDAYVAEYAKGAFATAKVMARLKVLHTMITPYVTGSDGEVTSYTQLQSPDSFTSALTVLQANIEARQTAATSYLATVP